MSNDELKRMIGAHAALAFLLLPGLCALPLLALISPAPARYVVLGVWALLALALAALIARVALRLRRAADIERQCKASETTPDLLS
jgi:Flp pilus assembly protein TadB